MHACGKIGVLSMMQANKSLTQRGFARISELGQRVPEKQLTARPTPQFNMPLDETLKQMFGLEHTTPVWPSTLIDHKTLIPPSEKQEAKRRKSANRDSLNSTSSSDWGERATTSIKFAFGKESEDPNKIMAFLKTGWQVFDAAKGDTICPPCIKGGAENRKTFGPLYW